DLHRRMVELDTLEVRRGTLDVAAFSEDDVPALTPAYRETGNGVREELRMRYETASITNPAPRDTARSEGGDVADIPTPQETVSLSEPSQRSGVTQPPRVEEGAVDPSAPPTANDDDSRAKEKAAAERAASADTSAAAALNPSQSPDTTTSAGEAASSAEVSPAAKPRDEASHERKVETKAPEAAQTGTQSETQTATTPKAEAKAEPTAEAVVPVGAVQLQIVALASRKAVETRWTALKKQHPDLFSDLALDVQTVESSGVTLYRLRVGPYASRDAAREMCATLKDRGGDCYVTVKK
ncbi:MAG: SPOR domain-containing protein, partial [Pseudomonadota bacterium]